jgi:stage II sporulation protein AB (anti-sigma F factor)
MKKHDKMKLEIESKSINEGFARAAMGAFAARLDPSIEELNDIKTAVSEAVTNCIVHAYPDSIGVILLVGRVFEDYIEIRVRDYGKGISDITKAREPMYTTGGAERSGMGFTVMESFMDELRVRSKEGTGTTVTMVKRVKTRK